MEIGPIAITGILMMFVFWFPVFLIFSQRNTRQPKMLMLWVLSALVASWLVYLAYVLTYPVGDKSPNTT